MSKSKRNHQRNHNHNQPQSLVDVVIPVFNQVDLLEKCVNALPGAARGITADGMIHEIDHTVVLVDDASTEDMSRVFLRFPVFRHKENRGFAAAVNKGVQRSHSPLVLILNSDCILHPSAIVHMVREMDNPAVGIVGALLTFPEEGSRWGQEGKVQHAGMVFNIMGDPFHVHLGWSPDNPRVNTRKEVSCVTGACLMTRRSLWNEVGGFNPVYGKGTFEDVEYCLSIMARGHKVVLQPKARGTHYVGSSFLGVNQPAPLQRNRDIWRSRFSGMLFWDEFVHW